MNAKPTRSTSAVAATAAIAVGVGFMIWLRTRSSHAPLKAVDVAAAQDRSTGSAETLEVLLGDEPGAVACTVTVTCGASIEMGQCLFWLGPNGPDFGRARMIGKVATDGQRTIVFPDAALRRSGAHMALVGESADGRYVGCGEIDRAQTRTTLELEEACTLAGQVQAAPGGPAPDVQVCVFTGEALEAAQQRPMWPMRSGMARTNENGEFRVSGLLAGEYRVVITTNTLGDLDTQVQVQPNQGTCDLRLQYPPGGSVAGEVVGGAGTTLGGVVVLTGRDGARIYMQELTEGAAGMARFRFPSIPFGEYALAIRMDDGTELNDVVEPPTEDLRYKCGQ